MICHYLLSSDETGAAIALSTSISNEEKCTQYKLGMISNRYRMNLLKILDLLKNDFVDNSSELYYFLSFTLEPKLNAGHKKFIKAIRESDYASVNKTEDEDLEWFRDLLKMKW